MDTSSSFFKYCVLAAIMIGEPVTADSLPSCSCKNVALVKMRMQTANAALEAATQLVETYGRMEESSGKEIMHTAEEQAKADSEIQSAINDRETLNNTFHPTPPDQESTGGKPTPISSSADTNGGDCKVTIRSSDECIRSILEIHEAVHQKACNDYHGNATLPAPWNAVLGGHADYKDAMRMVDYYKEEVRAYQAELAAIDADAPNKFENCRKLKIEHQRNIDNAMVCKLNGLVSLHMNDAGQVDCGVVSGGCETVSDYDCHGKKKDVNFDAAGSVKHSLSGIRNENLLELKISPMLGEMGTFRACNPKNCANAPFVWGVFPPQSFTIVDTNGAEAWAKSKFGEYHFTLDQPWK